jgi:glycine/D-amino acid oxidase-like deaminating enzyme
MLDFDKLSYWEKETFLNHTDYLILGAGIVGLSLSIHLKERHPGKKVTILERGYLPSGASSKNAGFACIGSPSELLEDLTKSSEEIVFETVKKRWEGLNYLKKLLGTAEIGFEQLGSFELFRKGEKALYQNCVEKLPYLNDQLSKITGISEVFTVDTNQCKKANFNEFTYAIRHAAEGQIDTGKMIHRLTSLAISKGVIILNGMSAKEIKPNEIVTDFGSVPFHRLGICTNGFARQFLPLEDVQPARGQVVVTSEIPNLKFQGIYHVDRGYYYFRNLGNRVLFGGGRNLDFEGENTTQLETSNLIQAELERILREEILPDTNFEIEHTWSGIMGVGATKAPIIKQISDTVYCGVRMGGMGVAIGSLVGKELAELMTKND